MSTPSLNTGNAWRIDHLDETDSTQLEAHRRAVTGERGPLWIRASRQTQGKGRSGRQWATGGGNLAATLLFAPDCLPALQPQLSLVAGIAAYDAVAAFKDAGPQSAPLYLKWPNDLLIGDAKLAGILIESTIFGVDLVAIAGVGINLSGAPEIAGRRLTYLAAHSAHPPSPSALLETLDRFMRHWLNVWNNGAGFALIRAAWRARALPEGAPIMVNAGDGPVHGTFAGLDIDGALLLLEPSGHRRRFSWGDVTVPAAKV